MRENPNLWTRHTTAHTSSLLTSGGWTLTVSAPTLKSRGDCSLVPAGLDDREVSGGVGDKLAGTGRDEVGVGDVAARQPRGIAIEGVPDAPVVVGDV